MRITVVTETFPPEVNGVAMTIARLVEGLAARGHRLSVVRPRPKDGSWRGDPGYDLLVVAGLPLPRYPGLRLGLPAGARLRRMWREARPDVVHVVTEGPLGLSAVRAARRLGIPVSSGFHTNFHTYGDHYGYRWIKRAALGYLRRLHNRTDLTLVPSETSREGLLAQGFKNVQLLPRGVDTALFDPARRDRDLRRSWGAGGAERVALYVGRLAPEKNLPLVVDAFQAMRAIDPALQLVLVGDGPDRAGLERGHPEFHFAGMRLGEDLARHYASADLFLFPSLTETFGNVVTEAMASGLLVLAYDYAAAGRHVVSGQNGWTVPFDDRGAFVRAAVDLVGRAADWPLVRQAARRTATDLSWGSIVEAFEAQLRTLASTAGRSGPRPSC